MSTICTVEVAPAVVLAATRYLVNRSTADHLDGLDLIRRHADVLRTFSELIIGDLEYVLRYPHPGLSDYDLRATESVLRRCKEEWR